MIRHNGRDYVTISDAAQDLKVTPKTVREYVAKGIIPEPPEFDFGIKRIAHFPPEYMKRAKADLERYRRDRKSGRSRE